MNEATIRVRVICQREAVEQVTRVFARPGEVALPHVDNVPGRASCCVIEIDTGKLYTDEGAIDVFDKLGYDTLFRLPGILSIDIVSSLEDRPVAMEALEAERLADRIRKDAPFLNAVTIRPAHEINDDFLPDQDAFVCWIEGRGFSAEVYTEREWAGWMERLEYEQRMAVYAEQIDESGVEPFYRYVVDGPLLPAYGTYSYLELERRAARQYLLDVGLPPWRSAVRSAAGVKAIYLLSGIRVPVSVAPFAMRPGDQALVVTPEGEVGLLLRDK